MLTSKNIFPKCCFLVSEWWKNKSLSIYSRALVEILHRLRNIELYETRALFLCFSVNKKNISFQVKHVCTGRWHSVLQEALPGDSGCQEHTDSRLIAEQPRESVCQ